jgi:hypothetical protein
MKRRTQYQAKGALEWIEEATHLLRTSGPGVLAAYYIGALPFVLGLLFFWADMSRSPFAKDHVVEAALGMALLFLWMKTWQAFFCLGLRALVAGEPMERLSLRRVARVFAAQTAIQPSGLLLIPLGLLLTLPFGWVFGFYQNATAFAEPGAAAGQSLFKRAARGTRWWTGQYHLLLLVLGVFAFLVFLNWTAVCLMLPGLLKSLAGIETTYSRSPLALLNTTFFATMAGLTYLSVDPLVKALHVLRCFRGEAASTGDDLVSELRHATQAGAKTATIVLLSFLGLAATPARAAEPLPPRASATAPAAQPGPLPSHELNRAINDVINQQKYTWRMPREKVSKAESSSEGSLARFFRQLGETIRKWTRAAVDWLDRHLSRKPSPQPSPAAQGSSGVAAGWAALSRLLLYGLLGLAVAALAYLAYRLWRSRRPELDIVQAEALQVVPDLTEENLSAAQLPEDEWTRLARELLTRGEFRLAMRAYYLSSLAMLGERRLITLAKFKSNREYERELARRGHALGEAQAVFSENVLAFDRVWYGRHAVDAAAVDQFAGNVQRLRAIP